MIPALKIFIGPANLKEAWHIMQHSKLLTAKSKQEDDYCPNLIKYYGLFENDAKERLGILTEYFENNNLRHIIEYLYANSQLIPEDKCIKYTFQLVKALNYLHTTLDLIHLDVRTRNIYIQNDTLKLGDLSLARSLETYQKSFLRSNKSTPNYMSPEFLMGSEFSANTDVWSAGCVLFEMLKLKKAYDGQNFHDITTKIIDSDAPRLDSSLIFKPILAA